MKTNKLLLVASAFTISGALVGCNKNKTYKVAFVEDYQGGKTTFVDVQEGKRVAEPPIPTRADGATFNGWRIGSDDTSTRFDFEIPIYQDTVFYGSWIEHYEPITEVDELSFKRGLATCALGHATASFNKCEFNTNDFNNQSSANTIYKNLVIKNNGELEHIKGVKLDPVKKETSNVEYYNQYDNVREEYHTVCSTEELYGDYYGQLKNPKTYIRSVESEQVSKFTKLISSFLYSDNYELNYSKFSYNKNTKMYETTVSSLLDGDFKIKFENGYVTKLIFKATNRLTLRTILDIDVDFIDINKTKIDFPKSLDVKVFDFANKLDSSYEYSASKTSIILYDGIYSADTTMKFTPSIELSKTLKSSGGSGFVPASQAINVPITNEDDLNYFLVKAYKDAGSSEELTIENNTIKDLETVTAGNNIYVKSGIGFTNGSDEFTKNTNSRASTSTFAFKGSSELTKVIEAKDVTGLYTNKVLSHEVLGTIIKENIDLGNGFDTNQVLFNFSSPTEGVDFSYGYVDGGKKLGNYPDIVLSLNATTTFELDIKIEIGYSETEKTLKIQFNNIDTYYEAQAVKFVGEAPTTPLEYILDESKPFVGDSSPAIVQEIRDFYDHKSTNQEIAVKLENNDRDIEATLESNNIKFTIPTLYEPFTIIEDLTLYIGVNEDGSFIPLDFVKVNISCGE